MLLRPRKFVYKNIFKRRTFRTPKNNSVLVSLLTFGQFEMISDNIVDGTIAYLDNLKNLFIKK